MTSIKEIANELNKRSKDHKVGQLQSIRTEIKKLDRKPSDNIFTDATTFDEYAFHYGGRKELQFNIGFEDLENNRFYRHGVAFSLEPSQTLPDVTILYPKIIKFNEYMRLFLKQYYDFSMWYYDKNKNGRSPNLKAGLIEKYIIRPNVFIFFGKLQGKDELSYDEILNDFDRLLPLYTYVESEETVKPEIEKYRGLNFTPGCAIKKKATRISKEELILDIDLRHNRIQEKLYNQLIERFGRSSVGTECSTTGGNKIDLVVKNGDELIYYEIKTSLTAKTAIREALSQLIEYSYWPGGTEASKLVVVSEAPLDDEADNYLQILRQRFSVPVFFEQVII